MHPGKTRQDMMPWANRPAFFTKEIQDALAKLPKTPHGWRLTLFEALDDITSPWVWQGMPMTKEAKALAIDGAWARFRRLFDRDRVGVTHVLQLLTKFHAMPAINWNTDMKVALLANIPQEARWEDRKRVPVAPRKFGHVADLIEVSFGNKVDADQCRRSFNEEKKRRLRILSEWDEDQKALNEVTSLIVPQIGENEGR